METITLDGYADVREAFRSHDLEQALYDAGGVVMADSLLVLHGAEHRRRRRVENRLFRRGTFRYWEKAFLRDVVRDTLTPFVAAGRADLVELGYRTVMNLTAMVAGLDQPADSVAAADALYRFAKKFSEGATLVHTTRAPEQVRAEVQAALEEFDVLFLQPSIARRQALVERLAAGEISEDDLSRDVLTALLRNGDELGIDRDVLRRECAFYLQAGSHSTADAFTHAADDFFAWGPSRPPGRREGPPGPGRLAALRVRNAAAAPGQPRRPAPRARPDQPARRRRDPRRRVRRPGPGRRQPRPPGVRRPRRLRPAARGARRRPAVGARVRRRDARLHRYRAGGRGARARPPVARAGARAGAGHRHLDARRPARGGCPARPGRRAPPRPALRPRPFRRLPGRVRLSRQQAVGLRIGVGLWTGQLRLDYAAADVDAAQVGDRVEAA